MPLARDDLHTFLDQRLGVDLSEIDDETALFSGGVLDSFSLVDLILFLEERTGERVNPGDVRLEYLDSVTRILEFGLRLERGDEA